MNGKGKGSHEAIREGDDVTHAGRRLTAPLVTVVVAVDRRTGLPMS